RAQGAGRREEARDHARRGAGGRCGEVPHQVGGPEVQTANEGAGVPAADRDVPVPGDHAAVLSRNRAALRGQGPHHRHARVQAGRERETERCRPGRNTRGVEASDHRCMSPEGGRPMKIKIARDELLTGLQRVQGIVEKRNTMPVLSNILLETKQDGVELVATDLEIGIRGHYKAEVCQAGSVTLSARKLYEILKEVADGEVTFVTQEN